MNKYIFSDEIAYQLTNADCVAVFCHEEKLSVAREACKKCPNIRHIISFGQEEGVLSYHKLLKDDGKAIPNVQVLIN